MRYSARFPAIAQSVVEARKFVTDSIVHVSSDVSDTLLVITSELASNCIRHGATMFEVRIDQLPDRILVEAEDDGDGEPVVRSPAPSETSGRGLQIVKALADSWGVVRKSRSSGKTVWAVLAIPPASGMSTEVAALADPVTTTRAGQSGRNVIKAVRTLVRTRISTSFA
jgi:two-component sensor histidine kinase